MNRIEKTFNRLAEKKEKALVGFVTAGDPTIEKSQEIIEAMCDSGVDILELGVPFSDPTADGPVIQRSSGRSLANNTNLETVFKMTARLREKSDVPVVLFSYYNPIYCYGGRAFYRSAKDAGADGILIVDLPPEESAELTSCREEEDFPLIRLLAPTTPVDRIAAIAGSASGFLYLVSMTGVTGSSGLDTSSVSEFCSLVRSRTTLPLCVGFGISTAEHVKQIAAYADGVVIGSAFERLIEEHIDDSGLVQIIADKTREFKQATRL